MRVAVECMGKSEASARNVWGMLYLISPDSIRFYLIVFIVGFHWLARRMDIYINICIHIENSYIISIINFLCFMLT